MDFMLDLTDNKSITTENTFSFKHNDLETVTEKNTNLVGGGLFCGDEFTSILLECFGDERPDVACYLLCKMNKVPKEITKKDNAKRNIMHYFTLYASHGNMVVHLSKIIKDSGKSKIKNALRAQDQFGNTPLHYATELGFNNLVALYVEYGGDLKIKNNKGLYIEHEKDIKSDKDTKSGKPIDVSIIVASESPISDNTIKRNNRLFALNNIDNDTPVTSSLADILNTLSAKSRSAQLFSPTPIYDTDNFINEVQKKCKKPHPIASVPKVVVKPVQSLRISDDSLSVRTGDIIDDILNKSKIVSQEDIEETMKPVKQNKNIDELVDHIITRISPVSDSDASVKTDNIIGALLPSQHMNMMGGGKKKSSKKNSSKKSKKSRRIISQSRINTFSEVSPLSDNASDISDIARVISRQSSDIHERVITKIIELLKLNKDKAEDVQKARNYKAAVYRIVKEKNPLLNNFDRAVEMEKSVTLDFLKKIDIDKVTKEIEKHLSEKSVSSSSKTVTKSLSSSDSTTETPKKETKKNKETKKEKKQKRLSDFSLNSFSSISSLSRSLNNSKESKSSSSTISSSDSSSSYSSSSSF